MTLAKYWAGLADVFINDAFGSSHRKHASNYGIKKYIPSYYGLLIDEEITKLNELINNPQQPFLVIMGGAKVDDKLKLIDELLKKCNHLIAGGGIANTFICAKGYNVGKSLVNLENIAEIKKILTNNQNKIITPTDFYVDNNGKKEYRKLNEIKNDDIIYDIGDESLKQYETIINNAKTIFINGTVGLYENKNFEFGTKSLLTKLKNSKGKTFVGGGDAVSSTNKLGFENTFYYKSTGGGATLEYIIHQSLAALED